jgi:DNA polymerase-3 subunit gamma/tau
VATPSLYRRYRPRRFSELKGQDHVVRALRDAVAAGREGQAYLFSGPRGTGKTTSARILAKVLNCERAVDGEPCCECESCLAVERGTSYDVHELDAASNNKVENMRDLIEKASLGTPGRHRVYILDEVHMLTPQAEAALLKTLEEPPAHVVFVLATTDPQKVRDTIRSRTQHLRFHLLPADELTEHVRWVAADAGLAVDDAAIDAAISQGGGSARDTLSALELIANSGGDTGDSLSFDEFVEALIDRDAGHALTAMAHAMNAGHEARALAEALVRHLRNGFLSLMAPELVPLSSHQVDALAAQAQRLGPAALVRAIERLGEILVELRHAPDPRVLVEVALVQLTSVPAATTSDDIGPLAARVSALEQALAEGRVPAAAPAAPKDPTTGRTALGGRAARAVADATGAIPRPDTATPAPRAAPDTEPPAAAPPTAPSAPTVEPTPPAPAREHDLRAEWEQVRPTLRNLARALYSSMDVVATTTDTISFSPPNAATKAKCEDARKDVEAAWRAATGHAVRIQLVTREDPAPLGAAPPPPPDDEDIDLNDLVDAAPGTVPTTLDRLAEAFPGSRLVERGE